MREFPWPEMKSERRPNKTLRSILDYLHWIAGELLTPGFYSGSIRMHWARQVEKAYRAMFIPMMVDHGDPYPPAVPAAVNPGTWPDFPSASIPGMTLRHQISVLHRVFEDLRDRTTPLLRPRHVREWDRRLSLAYEALWHGEAHTMPDEAKTETKDHGIKQARKVNASAKALAEKRAAEMRKSMTGKFQPASVELKKQEAARLAAQRREAAKLEAAAAKKKAAKKRSPRKKKVAKKAAKKKIAKKATSSKKAKAKGAAKKPAAKKKAVKKKAPKKVAKKTSKKRAALKKNAAVKKRAASKKKAAKRKTTRKTKS